MRRPPLTHDEPYRLAALQACSLLETPIEERFERITRIARRLFDVPVAAVSFVDADRQWFKAVQGLHVAETPRELSFCGHAILQDGVMIVDDARSDLRFSGNPLVTGDPGIVFYAGCPVRAADGSRIGTLCIIDTRTRRLGREDQRMLRDLAAIVEGEVATTMAGVAQAQTIRSASSSARRGMIDPLTRLWNRKGILEVLERQRQHSRSTQDGCAVMLIDIDAFSRVGVELGRPAGEAVLRQVASHILEAVRETDAVGRYVDDGFMVVCGGAFDPVVMTGVAERLRRRVEEIEIEIGAEAPLRVTVSVGIACLAAHELDESDRILRAADVALEQAKRNGRNRVETCRSCPGAEAA